MILAYLILHSGTISGGRSVKGGQKSMDTLSKTLLDFAITEGGCAAGIATIKTLASGPPSADLTYVHPNAKSAVVFAVPLDQKLIRPFLIKQDWLSMERNVQYANSLASGISLALANYLEMGGITSVPIPANLQYRTDTPNRIFDLYPNISHRYLAVRSGVGHFGLSGNVITLKEGAAVILGSVVTTVELTPTDPLPPEENYCDGCGICMASCVSGFVDHREKVSVTLGGIEFTYSKRRDYYRCGFVCGGFTGLHTSGQWSTWSPGRFSIPAYDGEFAKATAKALKRQIQWPAFEGGFYNTIMREIGKTRMACAHCQLVCTPNREERKHRYKMLTESGVVVQNEDGSLEAVTPQSAIKRLASMIPETHALYEDI